MMRRFPFLRPLIVLSLLSAGCLLPGEGSREVRISPIDRPIQFEQTFDEAYAAPSPDEGYDLVLCSGYQRESARVGQRVYPAGRNRVSQVMHIHVSWRPARGVRSDFPAATNTTVDWFVFTDPSSQAPSYARYSGIGFAAVELGRDTTLFSLRDLSIRPQSVTAGAADPLGPSKLAGKIRADNDAPKVAAILEKLQQNVAPGGSPSVQRPLPQQPGMPPARQPGP